MEIYWAIEALPAFSCPNNCPAHFIMSRSAPFHFRRFMPASRLSSIMDRFVPKIGGVASFLAVMLGALLTSSCTPTYDWRSVSGTDAPYSVLLPSKPASHSREVNLGGIRASMTMRAAEVENVTFAVGTAELPDAAQAQAALKVMRDTMVNNIGGTVRLEKTSHDTSRTTIDLIAGPASGTNQEANALHARFVAQGRRVYQAIVVGREKAIRMDAVETFLGSFKTG